MTRAWRTTAGRLRAQACGYVPLLTQSYHEHHEKDRSSNNRAKANGDLVESITTNRDADWSFGNGRAQFLTES
jgi:hypothetical protein